MSTNTYTFDRSGDFPQNKNTLRHGAVSSLPTKEQSNPVVPPAAVASGPYLLHTKEHGPDCKGCAAVRFKMNTTLLPGMPFMEASAAFIELKTLRTNNGRARFVADRTLSDYNSFKKALAVVFEQTPLSNVTVEAMREYQGLRAIGGNGQYRWAHPAGANKIIKELGFLIRIMRYAGAWTAEHEQKFFHLQHIDSDIGYALSPAEQEHWVNVCLNNEALHFVGWYSIFAIQILARTKEIRGLRLADVNNVSRVVMIRAATSKMRIPRTVPMDGDALWAAEMLQQRARAFGASLSQHYLFPWGSGQTKTADRPMTVSGIKKPWAEACKLSGIKWRISDTRHTGFTRLAEAGTPIHVMMSMGGHIRPQMQQHYIHIAEQSKRVAVESAFRRKPNQSSYPQMVGNRGGQVNG